MHIEQVYNIKNDYFLFLPLPTIMRGFLAFINSSAADLIHRMSGKIIGGCKTCGFCTILFIGIRADNRFAGKSKYVAPKLKR